MHQYIITTQLIISARFFLQVDIIDSLPSVYPKVDEWLKTVVMEEGNATILTLFVCLLTVLYLRERQRRQAVAAAPPNPPPRPNDNIIN